MALSQFKQRKWSEVGVTAVGVKANEQIWGGGALMTLNSTGHAEPIKTAGAASTKRFAGFAVEDIQGSATAGAVQVRVQTWGMIRLPVTGLTATSQGGQVYASDDSTFTMTNATGLVPIGKVAEVISDGEGIVQFNAYA